MWRPRRTGFWKFEGRQKKKSNYEELDPSLKPKDVYDEMCRFRWEEKSNKLQRMDQLGSMGSEVANVQK
jgi:hypothetical protein